jgi:hypothetical protein
MNPIYGAVVAGGRSFASRFSFYLTLQVATVLAPGLVIGSELALLIFRAQKGKTNTELHVLAHAISSLRGAGLFFAVVVAVASCYVVGYICREAAFKLLGGLERISGKYTSVGVSEEEVPVIDTRQVRAFSDQPFITRIRALAGDQVTDACIELHPILRVLDLASTSDQVTRRMRRVGGAHVHNMELEAFAYCKIWLRRYAPELGIDQIEAEINILVAVVIPVLLAAPVAIVWSGHPLVSAVIGVPAVLAIGLAMFRNAARQRKTERWEAFRNLVEDHMMRTALSSYEQHAEPVQGPERSVAEPGSVSSLSGNARVKDSAVDQGVSPPRSDPAE